MRGHIRTAISHIEGGVRIISELQPSNKSTGTWSISTTPYADPSTLNTIFIRLDRQACQVLSQRKRLLLDEILDDKASGYHEDIPLILTSFEQARNSLDHIRTFSMRFVKSAASQPSFSDPAIRALTLAAMKSLSLIKVQQWSTAFNSFVQNKADIDAADQEAMHVLEMHRIVTGMVLEIDEDRFFADGTLWDRYAPQFQSIISHAMSINKLHLASCEKEGRKQPVFHLDAGIGFPLFFVASSCRDGALRRRAIELLRAVDRQECVMNSLVVARLAERFMSIEEEGLVSGEGFLKASEVPRENRLAGMELRWMTDQCVQVAYSKMGRRLIGGDGYEGGTVVVEECIEW